MVTFYLTKTENSTKNLYHSPLTIVLGKGTISAKKCYFFAKGSVDISKTKRALILKGVFSETTYV